MGGLSPFVGRQKAAPPMGLWYSQSRARLSNMRQECGRSASSSLLPLNTPFIVSDIREAPANGGHTGASGTARRRLQSFSQQQSGAAMAQASAIRHCRRRGEQPRRD